MKHKMYRLTGGLLAVAVTGTFALPPGAQEDSAAIPWTVEGLRETFVPGTRITYSREGTNSKGEEIVGGNLTLDVTEATEQIVGFTRVAHDPGLGTGTGYPNLKWEDAMFLISFSGGEATVVGEEQVETPAGTFDTVVVEVTHDFFDTKHVYYMIADQPGVYAKFIDYGKEREGEESNIVMTLEEVSKPDS